MRFLVLGVSGMAGHAIGIYLKENGHDVVGYCRRPVSFVEFIKGDAKNVQHLRNVIETGDYDFIVNAIGVLNQFAESDKESAAFLNGYLPHLLAKLTQNIKTRIIHISTDCVFSGRNAPYTENSFKDGESFYDRSKALGELNDKNNLTLRNSIVGPDINENGIGLFNWFMKQNGTINGYTNAMWTGMTTLQLAKTIEAAAYANAHGLVNMVYKENISKYELLKLFNHYLRNNEIKINPYDNFSLDKTLVRTNFEFDYLVPDYETMIIEMSEWIRKHKYLYPHYKL